MEICGLNLKACLVIHLALNKTCLLEMDDFVITCVGACAQACLLAKYPTKHLKFCEYLKV